MSTKWERGVAAKYGDPGLEIYRGNPFLEALPNIPTADETVVELSRTPRIGDDVGTLEPHLRVHLVEEVGKIFVPLEIHENIAQRISCLLRNGYVARNPLNDGEYWARAEEQGSRMNTSPDAAGSLETTGNGFMILGGSGNGKTTTVQRILHRYPQLIRHTKYKSKPFSYNQIVWLRLEAPERCSLQELILTFFAEIDALLGTDYYRSHGGNGRLSPAVMVPRIAAIVHAHAIGMIVFDELQNVRPDKSGGHLYVLNFLTKLINVTQIPVVTIGTFQAAKILCAQFRLLRRITSGGGVIWDRMDYGPFWKVFVKQLWKHQCLVKATPYSDWFAAILYEATQGIAAYAVAVFQETQRLAINLGGDEAITENLLRSAAEKQTGMVKTVIRALKNGNPESLPIMDDVFMPDLDWFISTSLTFSKGEVPQRTPPPRVPREPSKELRADLGDPVVENTAEVVPNSPPTPEETGSSEHQKKILPGKTKEEPKPKRRSKAVTAGEPTALLLAMRAASETKIALGDTASECGFLRDAKADLAL